MPRGPLLTVIVALLAFGVVIYAFSNNASPYVTVKQARTLSGDRLHIAGDIVKNSIYLDIVKHKLSFDMKDSEGTPVHVVQEGELPGNLQEAKRVVAIGAMQGNEFVAQQLLIKCPSKYQGSDGGNAAQS